MITQDGWAVASNFRGDIYIKTVSDTRRAAIINWLVTEGGIPITKYHTDADIERLWNKLGQYVEACPVKISKA